MIKIVKTVKEIRAVVKEWKKRGLCVGLVPTMGYLHEGHKSLIDKSVAQNDKTVVGIFVNPIQFCPNEDLDKYPRDIERDKRVCERAGAALIFAPDDGEMYGKSFSTHIDVGEPSAELCGKSRPCHFSGVATVVAKLFNIISPDRAYFGQKDAQQLAVIKRMVEDLNIEVEIVSCPIVRESDGLAMSSRNVYLNKAERAAALCLYKAILKGRESAEKGERAAKKIENAMRAVINEEPLAKIDYVKVVDAAAIRPVLQINVPVLCAMAVYIGKTRLIDNFIYEV
jgi:pantoate--beta-alanine ligase